MRHHLYIITGASRGLGLGMARQLVQPGHSLVCIARNGNHDLAALAAATPACSLEQWSQDFADGGLVAAARLRKWLHGADGQAFATATLINNAAVLPAIAPLADTRAADVPLVLRVGLEAPMQLTAAFLQCTARWPGRRRVLNISSGNGRRAMASQSLYSAAKAGMDHFSRCVALEEAAHPNGARICSLAPGIIDTDMQTHLRGTDADAFPDHARFVEYHRSGQLLSIDDAAARVLRYLERPDFGDEPVADVRS